MNRILVLRADEGLGLSEFMGGIMYKRALHFAFIILTLALLCSCRTAPASPVKNDKLSGNDTVLSGDVNSEAESSSSGEFVFLYQ